MTPIVFVNPDQQIWITLNVEQNQTQLDYVHTLPPSQSAWRTDDSGGVDGPIILVVPDGDRTNLFQLQQQDAGTVLLVRRQVLHQPPVMTNRKIQVSINTCTTLLIS